MYYTFNASSSHLNWFWFPTRNTRSSASELEERESSFKSAWVMIVSNKGGTDSVEDGVPLSFHHSYHGISLQKKSPGLMVRTRLGETLE